MVEEGEERKEAAHGSASRARVGPGPLGALPPGVRRAVPHAYPAPTVPRVPGRCALATRPEQDVDGAGRGRADRTSADGARAAVAMVLVGVRLGRGGGDRPADRAAASRPNRRAPP